MYVEAGSGRSVFYIETKVEVEALKITLNTRRIKSGHEKKLLFHFVCRVEAEMVPGLQ